MRAYRTRGHGSLNCPKDRDRIIVFPMLNEAEAFESEKALIELFGRKDLGTGCLRNCTSGGDGVVGWTPTPEWRSNQSKARKGKSQSPELVAKRAAALQAYWDSNPDTTERDAKISEKAKNWFTEHSEEEVRARKERMSREGYSHTEEAKRKMSAAQQKRHEKAKAKP
jgi:hypothetical protein